MARTISTLLMFDGEKAHQPLFLKDPRFFIARNTQPSPAAF